VVIIAFIIAFALAFYLVFSKNGNDENQDAMMEEGERMMEENNNDTMMDEGVMEDITSDGSIMMEGDSMMTESPYSGEVIAGEKTPLIDFNKADYEKALAEEKMIVLYFFANWCPTCKEEVTNALYPAFDELDLEGVVGFRVNYNDNQTDNDEKDLAREFGVAYQHTKVFVKDGERILKSPESWDKGRYLEEINSAIK